MVALFRPPMSFSALYVLSYGASSSSLSSSSSEFFLVTEIADMDGRELKRVQKSAKDTSFQVVKGVRERG